MFRATEVTTTVAEPLVPSTIHHRCMFRLYVYIYIYGAIVNRSEWFPSDKNSNFPLSACARATDCVYIRGFALSEPSFHIIAFKKQVGNAAL